MAYSYVVNNSQELIVLSCSGDVEFAELNNGLGLLSRQPEFNGVKKVLTELAGDSFLRASSTEIERHARKISAVLKKNPLQIAFVAQNDLSYGLFRMFAAYIEYEKINVFRTKQEACDWLQVLEPVG